jgi:outer membrane protein assembly factor BamB
MTPAMGLRSLLLLVGFVFVGLACSRTELFGELETAPDTTRADAGGDAADAALEAGEDASLPIALVCPKSAADLCGTNMYEPGAPWPTYQRCSSHAGRTTVAGPTHPVVRWKSTSTSNSPDLVIGPPSVAADGTIYVSAGGALLAFNPDGSTKWSTALTLLDTGESTVAIGPDGTIFVSLDRVYAVSPAGGTIWTSLSLTKPGATTVFGSLGSSGSSVTLGPCGTLYIGSTLGLLMLDQEGDELWDHQGPSLTPAVDSNGSSFYGAAAGQLFAVDPLGATTWAFTPPANDAGGSGWIQPAPILGADGTIYYSGADGLYAVGPDGTLRWKAPWGSDTTTGSLASAAVGADGTIYVAAPDTTLEAISPDGALVWSLPIQLTSTPPIVDGNGVIFALGSAGVYAILPAGQIEWTLTVSSAGEGAFALGADGTLYLATDLVYAIGDGP